MTNGFTRRKEQSKEEIRRAAWELFSQFGVEKVSVADIARKAGVSHATIYNNFGSKEALIREFVTTSVDLLVDRAQEALTPDLPFDEKMAAFMGFIAGMLAGARPAGASSPVFTGSIDLQNDPEIRNIREAAQERMTDLLLGLVREGREQGRVSADLSEAAISAYLRAFMDVFIDPQFQQQSYSEPNLVKDLGALILDGLRGRLG